MRCIRPQSFLALVDQGQAFSQGHQLCRLSLDPNRWYHKPNQAGIGP